MHLVPEWLFTGGLLLAIYACTDWYYLRKEPAEMRARDLAEIEPIRIKGGINLLYLAGIIASVIFLNQTYIPAMGAEDAPLYVSFLREEAMLLLVALSLATTRRAVREENHFSWEPITEVAILFVGIFTTMTPALLYLNEHAASLGLHAPWQFFYSTGLLSSFLDNAPTAVAFHTVASGLPAVAGATYVAGIPEVLLKAVALGAVFFGSMTYIGNDPNFMVVSIVQNRGVRMPSFFGFVAWSYGILVPIFLVLTYIFLM